VVALIKRQFGTFTEYERAKYSAQNIQRPQGVSQAFRCLFEQRRLWVLLSSLQSHHLRHKELPDARQTLKQKAFSRLFCYAKVSRDQREQNFRALQFFMVRQKRRYLERWLGRYRFKRIRIQKMVRALGGPIRKIFIVAMHRLQQLLFRKDFYEGFALEREYYMYMVTNQEFQLKADVLHEMEEEAGTHDVKVAQVKATATKKAPSNAGFTSPRNKLSIMRSPSAVKP